MINNTDVIEAVELLKRERDLLYKKINENPNIENGSVRNCEVR